MAPSFNYEAISDEDIIDLDLMKLTPPLDEVSTEEPLCEEQNILIHALFRVTSPQNLKLVGYKKHRKMIILMDNNSTLYFIHHRVEEETLYYVHTMLNFKS